MDAATLQAARQELPREYGVRVVTQRGRKTVIVRVPRAQPDYNYELAKVAFYTTLEDVQDAKDVLLVGDDKTVRMEPLRLRDCIREQNREDKDVVTSLRARLPRDFGWTLAQSPGNMHHKALAVRLPVESIAQADEAMLLRARAAMQNDFVGALRSSQFVYLFADRDFGRVGRRILVDAIAGDLAETILGTPERSANPLHLGYQTPGHFIKQA